MAERSAAMVKALKLGKEDAFVYRDAALKATCEKRADQQYIGVKYLRDELNRVWDRKYCLLPNKLTNPDTWDAYEKVWDDFDYTDHYNRVWVFRKKKEGVDWVQTSYVGTWRNDLGQVRYESQKHGDGPERGINYGYYQGGSEGGQLKYVYYPSGGGNRIQWQYDSRGRPKNVYRRVNSVDVQAGHWDWNADSTVSWFRRGNDVDTWHGYDNVGRVNQMKTWRGSAVEFNTFFEYDAVGNRITQRIAEEYAWDELYDYDTLHRLKTMRRGQLIQQGETWMILNLQRLEDWGLDRVDPIPARTRVSGDAIAGPRYSSAPPFAVLP